MKLSNQSRSWLLFLYCFLLSTAGQAQKQLAITMDDPNIKTIGQTSWRERDEKIRKTLSANHIQAALFVCGMRVDSTDGRELLTDWDNAGHLICNHSYSHLYFNGKSLSARRFITDFKRGDSIINQYKNFTKLFRFPYLKEGNTREKTDSMRAALKTEGYRNGHVSIDASDWYIDGEMIKALQADPNADLSPYRAYYIQHILNRAQYYDSLAQLVWKKTVKHTLLVHHSLLNALFLDDVVKALQKEGWTFINASEAFADPVYFQQPQIVPAGESIIWQLARQDKKYADGLRYPAEDGAYEEEALAGFVKEYRSAKSRSLPR